MATKEGLNVEGFGVVLLFPLVVWGTESAFSFRKSEPTISKFRMFLFVVGVKTAYSFLPTNTLSQSHS
jgi:hypothetical protein